MITIAFHHIHLYHSSLPELEAQLEHSERIYNTEFLGVKERWDDANVPMLEFMLSGTDHDVYVYYHGNIEV